ncbi:MAG: hypothetical protein ACI4IN_02340 [Eubacterium sp.]
MCNICQISFPSNPQFL